MRLPFLDRDRELTRLSRFVDAGPGLAVVYGRRRLGKSRLIQQALEGHSAVYYVGDARDAGLQRAALAREVEPLLPGFASVQYPDWASLLERLWRDAPAGTVVAMDEMPELVLRSPELPSLLQKLLDAHPEDGVALVVAGSSQRMMHGLVLDGAAPLYGRAREIIRVEPLPAGWIRDALGLRSAGAALEHYTAWGGVPRYWELARPYGTRNEAFEALALDPMGVLHREPDRLLSDDMSDHARSASILALVGQGCHRVSEIAGRLGIPSTSLSHPLARLLDLGLLEREIPFGRSPRDTKRTYYRICDPFLHAWYRIVEPNRSRLEAGLVDVVAEWAARFLDRMEGPVWEELARKSVPQLEVDGQRFDTAGRWWGKATDGSRIEIDVVSRCVDDPATILVGEAKRSATLTEARQLLADLERKASLCPPLEKRRILPVLFIAHPRSRMRDLDVIDAGDVMSALS